MAGRLEAIWLKRAHRGPMDPATSARLTTDRGIVNNADRNRRRQITLIEKEAWQRMMAQLGANVDPSARRANLMVSGVSLRESRGRILRVGGCRILLLGETKPCERMDEAYPGLREAMRPDWNGGAYGEILDAGEIHVGDDVAFVETEEGAA